MRWTQKIKNKHFQCGFKYNKDKYLPNDLHTETEMVQLDIGIQKYSGKMLINRFLI